jgi:UDP-N-acetylmuramoyl-tripeptide--D-alanyl-D-alanine ligase
MYPMSAQRLAAALGGKLLSSGNGKDLESLGTDTRKLKPGQAYLALKGSNFDGEKFYRQALKAGAKALIGKRPPKAKGVASIQVADSLKALQNLAAFQRRLFEGPVIAISGSNGKTGAKECLAWLLGGPEKVLSTQGNWNNHIGLPLTLLQARPGQKYAVLELGMNHAGELRLLAEICRPDIAVMLNVGDAHLEFFKNRAGVAKAKEELVQGLGSSGIAVLNGDDPLVRAMGQRFKGRKIYFGVAKSNDVRGDAAALKQGGRVQLYRTLASVAAGLAAGKKLEALLSRLPSFKPSAKGRQEHKKILGADFILDMYNASPQSMAAGLELLAAAPKGKRVAVLGEMLELGSGAAAFHREAGRQAKKAGLRALAAVGPHASEILKGFGGDGAAFKKDQAPEAAQWLKSRLAKGDTVLVKGSRGMRLERVVQAL